MKKIFYIFLLLLIPAPVLAISFTWDAGADWDKYDQPGYSARVAIAAYDFVTGLELGRVFDDPNDRTLPVDPSATGRVLVAAKALEYPGGKWAGGFGYTVGKRISPFINYPQIYYRCATAGTSAASQADWTAKQVSSGSVSDGGNNSVLIPVPAHGWRAGDTITISGTTNYDGNHVLLNNTDADNLAIWASTFTAETFSSTVTFTPKKLDDPAEPQWAAKRINSGDAADTGSGTVLIPVPAHGWRAGDIIKIEHSDNYDGSYTLPAQTNGDADHLEISATYVAETFSGVDFTPESLTDGTAVWERTLDVNPWQAGKEYYVNEKVHPYWLLPNVEMSCSGGLPWNCYSVNGEVTDTGAGTVLIPAEGHGFSEGNMIRISGTTNYDGSYTLSAQTNGDDDHLEITAAYTAETIPPGSAVIYSVCGVSGSAEPDWGTIAQGQTIDDNGITWLRRDDRKVCFESYYSFPIRLKVNAAGNIVKDKVSFRGKCSLRSGAAR